MPNTSPKADLVLNTITKLVEMQVERRFPMLLQTEALFACV